MKNYRCAIFGQNTICFKWGFDEDDEYCIAMKQELLQKIMELREKFDLHRKVLRFVAEDVPSGDGAFIRE